MAQPKALKSPYSARPDELPSRVPSQEDFSDIAEDFSDIAEAPKVSKGLEMASEFGSPAEAEAAAQAMIPSRETVKGMFSEFAGGVTATGGGAVAGGLAGAGIGLLMGGPPGLAGGAELGAKLGGFLSGSLNTGDMVNFFRKAMSLPEEQDRNQIFDALASVSALAPGAGKFVASVYGAAFKTERNIVKSLAKLPVQERQMISALQQVVHENASAIGTEQFASTLRDEVAKDFLDAFDAGMNATQAASFVGRKFSDKLAYSRKFDELANRYGPAMTLEEIVEASRSPKERPVVAARPGDVLASLNQKYRSDWAASRKLIENNKDLLDKINLNDYLGDLKKLSESAEFRPEYRAKINNIIASIENSKSIEDVLRAKTMTPEEMGKLVIVDAETGKQMSLGQLWDKMSRRTFATKETQQGMQVSMTGARPQLGGGAEITREAMPLEFLSMPEGQPGFQFGPSLRGRRGVEDTLRATPAVSTPTEFIPAATQRRSRLTGQPELYAEGTAPTPGMNVPATEFTGQQEQLALSLNQKLERQKLATLDTIINLRMELDNAIKDFPNLKPKEAAVADAVTRLRSIEDAAIDGMMMSSDATVKNIGNQAKGTKSALASQLFEEELLGNVSRKDAIGYADLIDQMDPERVGAVVRGLAPYPEAKNKIAASYLDKKLRQISSGGITGLSEGGVERLVELASGKTEQSKKFLANIEIFTGDKEIQKDLLEAATLLKRATKVPNPAIKKRLSGEAIVGLASRLTRVGFASPSTWINILGPDNPEYAQKAVKQIFNSNREAFIDSSISSAESVLNTVVSLEDLFGRAALPMTSLIVNRAAKQGVLTGAALAALQPGANSTPAPMQ